MLELYHKYKDILKPEIAWNIEDGMRSNSIEDLEKVREEEEEEEEEVVQGRRRMPLKMELCDGDRSGPIIVLLFTISIRVSSANMTSSSLPPSW